MENIAANFNYNPDFIKNLQTQICNRIAEFANQEYYSKKNDFGYTFDNYSILKLSDYNKILGRITECDGCFGDYKLEDIVDRIKELING